MDLRISIADIEIHLRELDIHFHHLDDPALVLWEILNDYFPFEDPDGQFWWQATGLPLGRMLAKAGYGIELQCQQLLFYRFYVAPELGAGPGPLGEPRCWESFMTDNHTPVEFSWDWGCAGDDPIVRYSIEPISFDAGTARDPFNEYAADRMIRSLHKLFPNIDLGWFDHFSRCLPAFDRSLASSNEISSSFQTDLLSQSGIRDSLIELPTTRAEGDFRGASSSSTKLSFLTPAQTYTRTIKPTHKSRSFLAFDVYPQSIGVKAYFMPAFLALEATQEATSLLISSIGALNPGAFPCLPVLNTYLSRHQIGLTLRPEILGVDCTSSSQRRIKIYFRTRQTSLASVHNIMTMDSLLVSWDSTLERGFHEVEKLWRLVLNAQSVRSGDELEVCDHRTAGLLYYFEMREGQELPAVKLYIPVRHYGDGDASVQERLGAYLRSRGQSEWVRRFGEAIEDIYKAKRGKEIQTYIACAIKSGELRITSYISPEVYEC